MSHSLDLRSHAGIDFEFGVPEFCILDNMLSYRTQCRLLD